MAYSKRFPKDVKGSPYTAWEEVALTPEEEASVEEEHRETNIKIMRECVKDAQKLFSKMGLKSYQTDIINTATALFNQRSRHVVYHKEERAKEKFDQQPGSR